MNFLELLEQEEIWHGQDGFPYVIDEMDTAHIRNLIGFLHRRADNIYRRRIWREQRMMELAPNDVWSQWVAKNRRAIESDPEEWLRNRPLMQKLERVLLQRESIDADVLELEGGSGVMVRRDG